MLAPAAATAALTWETQRIAQRATPGAQEAEAVFPFTNTGTTHVTITDVQSSCGCTTAAPTQRMIAPGERGEVRAQFAFGGRTGAQEKQLVVKTDDGAAPATLTFAVAIPEALRASPRLLRWALSGPAQAQTVELVAGDGVPITKVVPPAAENFTFAVETLAEGARYKVTITPTATGVQQRATVPLQVEAGHA